MSHLIKVYAVCKFKMVGAKKTKEPSQSVSTGLNLDLGFVDI